MNQIDHKEKNASHSRATKAGVIGLTKSPGQELAAAGRRIEVFATRKP
jgi:NAD(P)-dependent dehydrogenase (short-subunit alcohol dehydrogenase family)